MDDEECQRDKSYDYKKVDILFPSQYRVQF